MTMAAAPDATDRLSPAKRALLELRLKQAAALAARQTIAQGPASHAIPRRDPNSRVPLSFAQQRMWLAHQLAPDAPLYNRPAHLRLRGDLDVQALTRTLSEIIRRHEALRATFVESGGETAQRFNVGCDIDIPFTDLTSTPAGERLATALRLATEDALRPFDLASGPLVRAGLLRLDDRDHVLLLTVHHIAFDAWSMSILLRELASVYEAFAAGRPSPLAEPVIQYADFAAAQRNSARGDRMGKQLAYWKEKLAGPLPVLELPTDRPRRAASTSRGGLVSRSLPPSLCHALNTLAAREGATLFITVLAAFKALLRRYTSQDDIVVASPVAGRSSADVEGLIGCFVNMLALRTDLGGDPPFRELLRRVRETALAAYDNQDAPVELLVQELRPQRDASRNPLFDVMFNYRNVPREKAPSARDEFPARLEVEECRSPLGVALIDLSLELTATREGFDCTFEYDADLFDRPTIDRMLRQFQTLLECVAADPSLPLSRLSLIDDDELRRLLAACVGPRQEFPADRCAHEVFESQASKTPDAAAVRCDAETLTYRELNERADQLAAALRAAGAARGALVGVCLDRSPEMIVALLGILKAGAAYVPFDPGYPDERIEAIGSDAGLSAVVTSRKHRPRFERLAVRIVCPDDVRAACAAANTPRYSDTPADADAPNRDAVRADDLCYVIYTSGSTGVPKGVAVRHRSLMSHIAVVGGLLDLTSDDAVLQFASLSFDASVEEIFCTLCRGATLVLRTDEMIGSADAFFRQCGALGISVLDLPTAYFHEVVLALDAGTAAVPPCVRLIVIGGEALAPERLAQWHKAVGVRVRLLNMYGPTEATVCSTSWDCAAWVGHAAPVSDRCPIGRPLPNTSAYVLDGHCRPVPVGVPGELYLGGEGLARGYLNRPELTAERFVPNLFDPAPKSRLYRTGDLARYLPDGNLEFLGRVDHQVKIRGFRIELGEVETALLRHPGVGDAVVVAWDEAGDKRLAAYVAAKGSEPDLSPALREFLARMLPSYMVPAAIMVLDRLPKTHGGKIDRRSLPKPQWARHSAQEHSVDAPHTTAETLAKIWADVLGLNHVGFHDNFFDLGGHSLLAARLLGVVNETFQVRLPLATLFTGATVAHMARELHALGQRTAASRVVCLREGGDMPPLFFLHGDWVGGGMYCRSLARYLDPRQPFYVLPPLGMEGRPLHDCIERMAAYYIRVIRSVRPIGPYALGGFCHGGMIAFEMARQLRVCGEDVPLTVLVASGFDQVRMRPFLRMVRSAGDLIGVPLPRQAALTLWVQGQYWLWKNHVENRLDQKVRRLLRQSKAAAGDLIAAIRRSDAASDGKTAVAELGAISGQADDADPLPRHLELVMAGYDPAPYAGDVLLLWPKGQSDRYERDPSLGWSRVACRLEVRVIPGNHTTCLTTHADIVGGHLRERSPRAPLVKNACRHGASLGTPSRTSGDSFGRKNG